MTLRAVPDPQICTGCAKPCPRDWCWDAKPVGCPMGRPPRNVDSIDLWRICNDQERRIIELEILAQWMGTLVLAANPDAGWPETP